MGRLVTLLAILAMLLSACDGEDEEAAGSEDARERTATATPGADEEVRGRDRPDLPGGELVTCESPAGFTLARPADWRTNSGDVVPACSLLNPEPFEVTRGTDERVAAVAAYIDPVAFARVAAPDEQRNAERWVTVIDGRQAVRLSYEVAGESLWPQGTPVTTYMADLPDDEQGRPQTFFLDTVGVGDFDYERNQVVLDRIAHTVEFTTADPPADGTIVARYGGGGGGFTVAARTQDADVCLRIPPEGEPACTEPPAAGAVHILELTNLGPVLAGVAGEDVFRVTAERRDGPPSTFLPVPIADSDVRGFAFTFAPGEAERLRLFDVTGRELAAVEASP